MFDQKYTNNCHTNPSKLDPISVQNSIAIINLKPTANTCSAVDITLPDESLVDLKLTLASQNQPISTTLCVHSLKQNRCLNQRRTVYVNPQPTEIYLEIDQVIAAGDNLVLYFTFNQPAAPDQIILSDAVLTLYQQSKPLTLPNLPITPSETQFTLAADDTVTISFPIISAPTTLDLEDSSDYNILLEPFHGSCPTRNQDYYLKQGFGDTISFNTRDCYDGIYTFIRQANSSVYPAFLVYAKGTNKQGIPLEIALKPKDIERKYYADLLPVQKGADLFTPTLTSVKYPDYLVEITSRGIGPQSSLNVLENLVIQPLPQSWLSLKLEPVNQDLSLPITPLAPLTRNDTGIYSGHITPAPALYTLPTATSPYWRAVVVGSKPQNPINAYWQSLTHKPINATFTTVNGWQPAWIPNTITPNQYLLVIYWPNLLAYAGLIFGLGVSLVLITRKERR